MSKFINTIDVLGDDAVIDSIIQRTITEFKDDVVSSIGDYAFYMCKSLSALDVPNATYITQRAFEGCTELTSVVIPKVKTIYDVAFKGCTKLVSIVMPSISNMTSAVFDGCTALDMVDIHPVCPIKARIFYGCSSLTALIIRGTTGVPQMSTTDCLTNTPIANGTGYIYVPKALVDSYKAATNWSTYANQIRAIEDYPSITGG